jgi:hypothetical protein
MGYLTGPRPGAQQIGAEAAQLGLLSGDVDTARFDPVADAVRAQAMAQLTGNVLPGIRQQITQYNPGGSTRGDIVQANAISAAQEDITNKIATAQFDAYKSASDYRPSELPCWYLWRLWWYYYGYWSGRPESVDYSPCWWYRYGSRRTLDVIIVWNEVGDIYGTCNMAH